MSIIKERVMAFDVRACQAKCPIQKFGFAMDKKNFNEIQIQQENYAPSSNKMPVVPSSSKFTHRQNKALAISSPQSTKSHFQLEETPVPVWASVWQVFVEENVIKSFQITLFNSKPVGKTISLSKRQTPTKNDQETTYIQIDDLECSKERNFIIISENLALYTINPNDFEDLGKNLKVGQGHYKIALTWTTKVKEYLIQKLFPCNLSTKECAEIATQTDFSKQLLHKDEKISTFEDFSKNPQIKEAQTKSLESLHRDEKTSAFALTSLLNMPSIFSKENCCNFKVIAIAAMVSAVFIGVFLAKITS